MRIAGPYRIFAIPSRPTGGIRLAAFRHLAEGRRIDELLDADALCMSFVTWAELFKGAKPGTRKAEVVRRLEALARQVPVHYPAGPGHYAEEVVGIGAGARGVASPYRLVAPDSELTGRKTGVYASNAPSDIEDAIVPMIDEYWF